MKTALFFLMMVHGLIHLLGPAKAFRWAEVRQLRLPVTRIAGLFWFAGCILFVGSSALLLCNNHAWWIGATAGIVVSQLLIVRSWRDARAGTAVNVIILVPVLAAFLNVLPSSFGSIYREEATKRISSPGAIELLTEGDMRHLPGPVQKYLRVIGAIGRPKVRNFRAVSMGEMRRTASADWLAVSSRQYDFFDERARIFFIESALYGIPFDGLHQYAGDSATMRIRFASAIPIAHARGDSMNRSETVTMFNDMCVLAPATLIDTSIRWAPIDSLHTGASFGNKGHTISAVLRFSPTGELADFMSRDRFLSADGSHYDRYPWSTPVKEYRDFGGTRIASYGEAIWHTPQGEYLYAKFTLKELEYNCTEFR